MGRPPGPNPSHLGTLFSNCLTIQSLCATLGVSFVGPDPDVRTFHHQYRFLRSLFVDSLTFDNRERNGSVHSASRIP